MKELFLKLPHVQIKTGIQLLILSILFLVAASLLKPHSHFSTTESRFEQTIPAIFGDWTEIKQTTPQVSVVSDERSLISQLYDDTLMRTYVDKDGHQIMLALAYAKEQRQDVKIHQPDICYPAQGYQMQKTETVSFDSLKRTSPVIGKRQLYFGQQHLEAVSYWIRVGDSTLTSGVQMRLKIIKDGLLKNRLDDGILVRVSSTVTDASESVKAYELQERFLKEFVDTVEKKSPGLLVPNHIK